jgi:amidase
MDVLSQLAEGVSGLRVGVLQEGFEGAEPEVRDLVLAAADVLARAGAVVSKVHVPQHCEVDAALNAVLGEGGLAVFKTGFFGAWSRTYYPSSVITAINQMWETHADVLSPRTKLSLIAAELSRRNYHGRVYAKGQNARQGYIRAYDAALESVDVLLMPTCLMTAPKNHRPASHLEALEDNLASANSEVTANTLQFDYTGHPALAVPVGKSTSGLPASMQLVGRMFDDPLLLRVAYAYEHSVDWDALIAVGPSRSAVMAD